MGELLQSLIANKPMVSDAAKGPPGGLLLPMDTAELPDQPQPAADGIVDLT